MSLLSRASRDTILIRQQPQRRDTRDSEFLSRAVMTQLGLTLAVCGIVLFPSQLVKAVGIDCTAQRFASSQR